MLQGCMCPRCGDVTKGPVLVSQDFTDDPDYLFARDLTHCVMCGFEFVIEVTREMKETYATRCVSSNHMWHQFEMHGKQVVKCLRCNEVQHGDEATG